MISPEHAVNGGQRSPLSDGGRKKRPTVRWFRGWSREAERALAALPEMPHCPHELFARMMAAPSTCEKRTALVYDGDDLIAVIGLRHKNRHWEPIAENVLPGAYAPAAPGRLIEAFRALGLFVWLNDWDDEVPDEPRVRFVESRDVYRISTRTDFDAFWRATDNLKSVKKARKRCSALGDVEFEVDAPGAAAWTIDNWRFMWIDHPWNEVSAAPELHVAADYLQARGSYHAFRLLINGLPVAGWNAVGLGTRLFTLNPCRDRRFESEGVGIRLMELVFRWTTSSPFELVDFGTGFDYKRRWAEVDGVRYRFAVAPARLAAARTALVTARSLAKRLRTRRSGDRATTD